jgi:hypothetical protein
MSSGNGGPCRSKEYGLNTPQGSPTSSINGVPHRINEYAVQKVVDERKLNFSRYFQFDKFIKISVEPNRVPWTLNKELACDRIPALKRAAQASPYATSPSILLISLYTFGSFKCLGSSKALKNTPERQNPSRSGNTDSANLQATQPRCPLS